MYINLFFATSFICKIYLLVLIIVLFKINISRESGRTPNVRFMYPVIFFIGYPDISGCPVIIRYPDIQQNYYPAQS